MTVPDLRVHAVNRAAARPEGDYVLYWMIAARRPRYSFALQHALAEARRHDRPLLVLEPLRVGYRWASDRLHRFVIDGMADNARAFEAAGVTYHPYVEPREGHGSGLLEALAARACLVVTDEWPCFFLPRMVAAAAERLDVRLEQVDGNGVMPLRASDRAFPTAHSFRRHLQKTARPHLDAFPEPDPLADAPDRAPAVVPADVLRRWPPVAREVLDDRDGRRLASLPIDHDVPPVPFRGGLQAAGEALARFLDRGLHRYGDERSHPDADVASGLSPWLHFGHIGAHEAVAAVLAAERWSPDRLAATTRGSRTGWWGVSGSAESFLDEIITWREVGFAFCFHRPDDYHRYESLPGWAQTTLAEHADDPRERLYTLEELARAETYDDIWNAAQRQLLAEGRIQNYLRMLWGKKILAWTPSPRAALDAMIALNDRYAVDGRDPNSYSGIFWTLGRFDRAWGPERPVFGKIRYMTSDSTRRKLRLSRYLERWGPGPQGALL